MWGKLNSFLNKRLAGNVPASTFFVVVVVVFSLWAGASETKLCCKLDWRVRLCVGLMVRRAWGLIMCSFCGELRGRSAGVGQTLTGVPAPPEGSTKRKPNLNVRREMLRRNKSTQGENWTDFNNKDSGLILGSFA